MKLPRTIQRNCFPQILEVFEDKIPSPLMLDQLDSVQHILAKESNIVCETYEEVMQCLAVMQELGLLQILEFIEGHNEKSFKVGNLYNGK